LTARVQALAGPFAKTSLTRARRASVDENEIDGLATLPGYPLTEVNTPPAKAGGFRLRLKAGLVRPLADSDGGCASSYLEIIVRFGRCLVLDIFGPYLIGNVSAAGDPISSAP
jgi:hypothetical protein